MASKTLDLYGARGNGNGRDKSEPNLEKSPYLTEKDMEILENEGFSPADAMDLTPSQVRVVKGIKKAKESAYLMAEQSRKTLAKCNEVCDKITSHRPTFMESLRSLFRG